MFDVGISVVDNKVLGEFIVDSYFFEPSKYEYAFYLYRDSKTVKTVWYKKSMDIVFDREGMVGEFYIKVFVKDIAYGNKRTFNSKKIYIDS